MDEAAERRKRLKSIRDAAEATPASSSGICHPCAGSVVRIRACAWLRRRGPLACYEAAGIGAWPLTGLVLHAEATASQHETFVNPLAAPESSAALPAPSFTFYRLVLHAHVNMPRRALAVARHVRIESWSRPGWLSFTAIHWPALPPAGLRANERHRRVNGQTLPSIQRSRRRRQVQLLCLAAPVKAPRSTQRWC